MLNGGRYQQRAEGGLTRKRETAKVWKLLKKGAGFPQTDARFLL